MLINNTNILNLLLFVMLFCFCFVFLVWQDVGDALGREGAMTCHEGNMFITLIQVS